MKNASSFERVIIPDSHGSSIDVAARDAFLRDLAGIRPSQIVWLGDQVDAGGPLSEHQASSLGEASAYSYDEDCEDANEFHDKVAEAAPEAEQFALEGNHELHVSRFAARYVHSQLAARFLKDQDPAARLRLKERGVKYFRMLDVHHGLRERGVIRLGKCCFTHGASFGSKHATSMILKKFNYNVVHGHTHRAAEASDSTVRDEALVAYNPGCLCEKRPLWRQTAVSEWTHGYGLQFVNPSGLFQHMNVKIVAGQSMLPAQLRTKSQKPTR